MRSAEAPVVGASAQVPGSSRWSHSRPMRCIQRVCARRETPATKSKEPPTLLPTAAPVCSRFLANQRSCLGAPYATSSRSVRASFTFLTIPASSSGAGEPAWQPAIWSPGWRPARIEAAAWATPGAAPRKKTRQPCSEASRASRGTRSEPATRSQRRAPVELPRQCRYHRGCTTCQRRSTA